MSRVCRETIGRATLALLAALAVVLMGPSSALADPTLTMNGEAMTGEVTPLTGSANLDCPGLGADPGSATYSVVGTAVGPYPGTFSETGTLTWQNNFIQSFTASFTIDSAGTHIEGTKQLELVSGLQCAEAPQELLPATTTLRTVPIARYEATISSPTGTFTDHGVAPVFIALDGEPSGVATGLIQETFHSDRETSHVELSPSEAVNTVGTQHTVTAIVQDIELQPLSGAHVLLTVEGSVSETGSCVTGADGTCDFTYTGPLQPGVDLITACYDYDASGTVDPGERCGTATKSWTLATSTPGQVSGGGYITTPTGNRVVFGFGAQGNAFTPSGGCHVIDRTAGVDIRCLSVSLLVIAGTHATFSGEAMVNGAATNYTIDVDDLGSPGALQDTFKIETDSGYLAAGVLTAGNVIVSG